MKSIDWFTVPVIAATLALSACGNGGNASPVQRELIGGNMVGTPLALAGDVTTSAGDGTGGAVDCTVGHGAAFDFPEGIATDGESIFIADSGNHTIRKMAISTGAVTTVAGSAYAPGAVDCTVAAGARFNFPSGITADGINLYVADTNNHSIRKIAVSTGAASTIAGDSNFAGYSDGVGTAAHFNYPRGITVAGTDLYVADGDNHLIRKVEIATGAVTTIAGDNSAFPPVPGYSDGRGTAAKFAWPSGITTDGTNLYVADTDNHLIRKIVIRTGDVTTVAGDNANIPPYGGDPPPYADGVGSAARFASPAGIATDGTNLYVADTGNNLVRKLAIATRAVTTIAGDNTVNGFADGAGRVAHFSFPSGIVTDGVRLFVADRNNNRIRRIR